MTLKIYSSKDLKSSDWESARADLIGSSEMATISLRNYYGDRTPIENLEFLWRQKKGRIERPDEKNPAMIFGNCTEDGIFNFFMQTNLEYLGSKNEDTFIWAADKPPYYSCTPDAFICYVDKGDNVIIKAGEDCSFGKDVGILELKTSVDFEKWREPNIPQAEYLQVQWQLGIMGLKWGILYCIVGGNYNNPRHIRIEFDESIFNELQNFADMFREALLMDEFPYAMYGEHAPIEIKKESLIEGKVINADDAILELVEEFDAISTAKSKAQKVVDAFESRHKEIKQQIVDAGKGATKILYGKNQYVNIQLVEKKPFMNKGSSYYRIDLKEIKL